MAPDLTAVNAAGRVVVLEGHVAARAEAKAYAVLGLRPLRATCRPLRPKPGPFLDALVSKLNRAASIEPCSAVTDVEAGAARKQIGA